MTAEEQTDTTKEEKVLRANDVKEGMGLSYRQLNDWESKGILPAERKDKSKWRKFTTREVFVLMVCKAIRDKFGVPLEKLGFIKSFMLQDDADHFKYALEHMSLYGATIYLLTDLKTLFIMDTDLEIEDLFRMGMFGGSDEQSYLLIKMNPLINRMLKLVDIEPCETTDYLRDIMHQYRTETTVTNNQEMEILKLIRDKKYVQVSIHLKDGEIVRANADEELTDREIIKRDKNLLSIVKGSKYQTVTVKCHDGKIVRLNRSTPIKFDKGTEKS